ncbi:MAG TPA: hypothetical protein VM100_03140 [Longimicrobiales bacterium]|nr:hypothetical protein [Longimicrobiales bacterium]
MRRFIYLFIASFLLPLSAHAQNPAPNIVVSDSLVQVRLADGSTLNGVIVSVTDVTVTMRTTAGADVSVPRSQIRSVTILRGTQRNGEVWTEDPNTVRLFVTPTGRTMPRGRAQFGVLELFFPFLSYGVTDRVTITVGTPVAPGIVGQVFYVAPKVEVLSTAKAHVSASVIGFIGGDEGDFGSAGILYGVGTFGSNDRAFTIGAGYPFYAGSGENEIADRPLLVLGGETRVSRRLKLMTESMIVSYRDNFYYDPQTNTTSSRTLWQGLVSGGVRFIGERISADFGLGMTGGDEGSGCCLPLVNFAYTFGKR